MKNERGPYNPKRSTLGGMIRDRRIAKNMTQDELATACKVTVAWLSAIERGKTKRVSVGVALSLSKVLSIKAKTLLEIGESAKELKLWERVFQEAV